MGRHDHRHYLAVAIHLHGLTGATRRPSALTCGVMMRRAAVLYIALPPGVDQVASHPHPRSMARAIASRP